jgi:hypothetical protein
MLALHCAVIPFNKKEPCKRSPPGSQMLLSPPSFYCCSSSFKCCTPQAFRIQSCRKELQGCHVILGDRMKGGTGCCSHPLIARWGLQIASSAKGAPLQTCRRSLVASLTSGWARSGASRCAKSCCLSFASKSSGIDVPKGCSFIAHCYAFEVCW